MAWFVQPLQRKDANGNPSGLWHLCAESDEGGGFYPGCDHDHRSAEEAQDCDEAKVYLGGITGFPAHDIKTVAGFGSLTDAQIKHMVDRFLSWRLPKDFNPDAGISFERDYNQHTPWPAKHEPVGTNLLTATQAEAMIRHMLEGLPAAL